MYEPTDQHKKEKQTKRLPKNGAFKYHRTHFKNKHEDLQDKTYFSMINTPPKSQTKKKIQETHKT